MDIKFATVGNGGTVHGTTDETKTLCGKPVAKMVTTPAATIACKACNTQAKKIETETPNNTEETTDMAKTATADDKAKADNVYETVKADIENMITALGTLTKSDADKIEATFKQGEAELKKLTANQRAGLIMRLKGAKSEAEARTTTALAHTETKSVQEVEGYKEIIEKTSALIADGIKGEAKGQNAAYAIAEAVLDARLRIFDKKGNPDLRGTRQVARDLSGEIYDAAAKKLVDDPEFNSKAADFDDLRDGMENKIGYQMSAVLPKFVRSLDEEHNAEQAKDLFPKQVERSEKENKPVSDIIFEEFKIDPESRAERTARKRAEKKAAELAAKKNNELTGGEGSGEGEGEGGEAAADSSTFEKDIAKLDKMVKDVPAIMGHVKDYTDEQKTETRNKLTALLSAISAAMNA